MIRCIPKDWVRQAVIATLENSELQVYSHRIECLKTLGKAVLKQLAAEETKVKSFDKFSSELLSLIVQSTTMCRSTAVKREKLCSDFHQFCLLQRPDKWEK